ncbi:polysaccharide deacetylase family protein [Methanosarcina vacuolata]|uniref:polysaccharide deacetylase family protein n=1 Tax=Methanosarcina vacuolata TaxID=2215 RepID=UPI00373AF603
MIFCNRTTFFILGYAAEHHPKLIRLIDAAGHEIGTHGGSVAKIIFLYFRL